MRPLKLAAMLTAGSLLLAGCAVPTESNSQPKIISPSPTASVESSPAPEIVASPEVPKVESGIATPDATEQQLLYLIEEEKLAHDVYTAIFDLWGARVFGNILKSEQTHQSQVLTVMSVRSIADPRSSTLGVFVNDELQALYDQLIAKGSKSVTDAYEVGVAIEVLDIDDLTKMLATAKDADVIAMMENLRKGSENHLRAFNNQL